MRVMNFEQFQKSTGWRTVFHCIPASTNIVQKMTLPMGVFYSPFATEVVGVKMAPMQCSKCKAVISSFAALNRQAKQWTCLFCTTVNPYLNEINNQQVIEYVEHKSGEVGIFLIIDLCLSPSQLTALKKTLVETINNMPSNIYIGLVAFNKHVFIQDFSCHSVKFVCLNGSQDYSTNNFHKLRDCLNILSKVNDQHFISKQVVNKYFVPIHPNRQLLIEGIQNLEADSYRQPKQERVKRALGCAVQTAIGLAMEISISIRFVTLISGPCTVGVGKVIDLPLAKTIRTYSDIFQTNENTQYVKSATAFYDGLTAILIRINATFDLWAYGLDQFGIMEMRNMVQHTGGILAMHEQFNHFIFETSFPRMYSQNQNGIFDSPFNCRLTLRLSKELRVNGILGSCKSLKQDITKQAAEMEIGEGGTTQWYLGGISQSNSLCIILSMADGFESMKQKNCVLQAITTYKYSDNCMRTRVSTIAIEILRQNQSSQLGSKFDQEAATVMLARMVASKTQVQDPMEVKKWLDRLLMKLLARVSRIRPGSPVIIPQPLKQFPQSIYHLRRSGFINPFGVPPDQSIYVKMCLFRESLANCKVMVQPALVRYSTNQPPVAVELDLNQLKDDVILMLDSYFNVLVWMGEYAREWKKDDYQNDPEYQYLAEFFKAPLEDASQVMYDRIPSSNYYETFKDDGKERYLKARVNPSKKEGEEYDGHFISDDATITLFMDYLMKSVVTFNQ